MVTKEHCCRSQMIHADTRGPGGPPPSRHNTPVFPSCYTPSLRLFGLAWSPWTVFSITVTDNMSCRLSGGFEKHSRFFLCTLCELQLRGEVAAVSPHLLPDSLNLKGTVSIFTQASLMCCIPFISLAENFERFFKFFNIF